MITLYTLWKLSCVQSRCSKRSILSPKRGNAPRRGKTTTTTTKHLFIRVLFQEIQRERKKAKWDREGRGRTKARTFITRLTSVTKGTVDCFVWWRIWEAISCTSEQSIIRVESRPFICWFFPVSYLSLFCLMKHYLWTFALCYWMVLGSSR